MGHALRPHEGMPHLAPSEIVSRLRDSFEYVDSSAKAGSDHVGGMSAHFLRMKGGCKDRKDLSEFPTEIDTMIERLEAARSEAIEIVIAENPTDEDTCVSFVATPDEELFIGYANARHEEIATPLVTRIADTLGNIATNE